MEKLIFGDKGSNYLFAVVSIIVYYFIFLALFNLGLNWTSSFWKLISLIISIAIVVSRQESIEIMTRKKLLFLGEELPLWIGPGLWFMPLFFSTAEDETQKVEKKDVIVEAFKCQDNKGKVLVAEANGDWNIDNKIFDDGTNSMDRYKNQDASKMESNLVNLIKRTILRITARFSYKNELLGENLGEFVLVDQIFVRECEKYGILFHNLLVEVIADNLKQENINSYYDELYEKEIRKYPVGHIFTNEELSMIEERIQVKMELARKIITNSAILGRYDV